LRGATQSALTSEVGAVLEIVIDGLTDADVRAAMRVGMQAVCALGAQAGVLRLSAGNYGGKLGQFHYRLREVLA
jgi:formylmethanofuran--tetrahydromethanopterin N-formyltransferase